MLKIKRSIVIFIGLAILIGIFLVDGYIQNNFLNNYLSNYFFKKGDYYYNGEGFDTIKARKWYQYSLLISPHVSWAHYQIARTYLVDGQYAKGIEEINEELALHPENKRSYYVKGLLDGYSKNYDQAEDDFKNFIDYAPDEWAGYMDLSWVYINSGKFQESIDITNKALNKFPQNPWLYSNNGLALYKSGKYEEAKVSLEKAKDLAKNLTADDWRKAYPGNNAQEADKGVKEIKAAIAYNLSLVYRNRGEIDKYLDEQNDYMTLSR